MKNEYFTIKQACQYLHVSASSLRLWEREGKIEPLRTTGNHRRYTKAMLDSVLEGMNNNTNPTKHNRLLTIGYCRVSSNYKKEDLKRQQQIVTNYCESLNQPFKIITDTGSGLNYHKKGLHELIHLICNNQCNQLVVNYQDRLVRFGFELIKQICDEHHVKLTVINQTTNIEPNQELVNDVLSIITLFSAELYGKRSHKNAKIIKTNEEMFK